MATAVMRLALRRVVGCGEKGGGIQVRRCFAARRGGMSEAMRTRVAIGVALHFLYAERADDGRERAALLSG